MAEPPTDITVSAEKSTQSAQARFGTFGGVFTPCVLTILGVIMFMRTGYVTGYAGIWLSLAILLFSNAITLLTTFSLSAIATNLKMGGGGPYYMISRVLGPDFGGSIGITLYFAQAVGVAFYVIGFTEALFEVLSHLPALRATNAIMALRLPQIVATATVAILFLLTFKGANVAIRVQFFILGALVLSVLSFIIGGLIEFDSATLMKNQKPAFTSQIGFWTVFAIFFPATTGITAGVNMSGDLKHPAQSIPKGTMWAIGITCSIYIIQILLMAGTTPRTHLTQSPFFSLQQMSLAGPLVVLGVFAATLSSALSSFLGAPRILQAMGQDRLMRTMVFFGKGSGVTNEPGRATVLTLCIAVFVIWAGDLNAVAEVISMFFLIAYGMINLSAFVESKSGNPSFRPTFRLFHWGVGLAGAIGCAIAMLKINDTYALIAVGITTLVYFYLKKQDISTSFGDAKRGYLFKRTRDNLLALNQSHPDPKNWRPIVTAISTEPISDRQFIQFGALLEGERGMYSIAHFVERPDASIKKQLHLRQKGIESLRRIVNETGVVAFPEVLVANDYFEGLSAFLQCYSLSGVRPNTVIISMPDLTDTHHSESFFKTVETIAVFDMNLVIWKHTPFMPRPHARIIDVWWRGERNGSLMALFTYLLSLNHEWAECRIRFLRITTNDTEERDAYDHMAELKKNIRLPIEVKVLRSKNTITEEIINTSGKYADLVLLGMNASNDIEARRSITWITPMLAQLPTTLMVWSNGEADIFA